MMWVQKTPDGIFLHDAETVELFSRELLEMTAKDGLSGLSMDGDIITIAVTNGTWRYLINPESESDLFVEAHLIDHDHSPVPVERVVGP